MNVTVRSVLVELLTRCTLMNRSEMEYIRFTLTYSDSNPLLLQISSYFSIIATYRVSFDLIFCFCSVKID